jgi:hypothetical protein
MLPINPLEFNADAPHAQKLLALLKSVMPTSNGWSARCPAHDDHNPSLSIAESDDGTVLMRCHAGCSTEAIVSAIGLKMSDLFSKTAISKPSTNGSHNSTTNVFATANAAIHALERKHGRHSVFWTYQGAEGDPVGVVVRWDKPNGKEIRPVTRNGDGWRIGAMPEPRPLYCLPELAKAERILVVEGEKCADKARALGFTATTSAGGSQAATKTDWTPLAGKEIWPLPDNDVSGRKYAVIVAGILAKLSPVPVVKIIELPGLPEGGDIVDWTEAQGDAAEPNALRTEIEAMAKTRELVLATGADGHLPDDPPITPIREWPEPPGQEAYYGLAGDIVRCIEPATEADPVAILVQFMVAFGNIAGRNRFFVAEGVPHFPNEDVVLVGETSKGRKGSSWGHVKGLFQMLEEQWLTDCTATGLSSGEGVTWAIRDPVFRREKVSKKGEPLRYEEAEVDPGVADKRLLIFEPEYANVLHQPERSGNTLSGILRLAWDGTNLRSLTKNSPAKATAPHISLIGHITINELQRYLSVTEQANGFGNRHLWLCVRRSKVLPEGGQVDRLAMDACREQIAEAIKFAKLAGEIKRDDEARALWAGIYGEMSEGKPGLTGAMLGRAEAHVMRLAMIYALLDCSGKIRKEHLMAAVALWSYCERCVRFIFGDSTGDSVADDILRMLRSCPQGLTRTEINDHLGHHVKSHRIGGALGLLLEGKLARFERENTGGRPMERWFAIPRK